jgi:hypothetical protein
MSTHKYTERELKFTAVIYASRSEIVEYIRKNGKLPARVPLGGFPTAMNLFAVKWGTQVELSEEARLVYDAILKDRHLPAGGVILFPDSLPIYSWNLIKPLRFVQNREARIGTRSRGAAFLSNAHRQFPGGVGREIKL